MLSKPQITGGLLVVSFWIVAGYLYYSKTGLLGKPIIGSFPDPFNITPQTFKQYVSLLAEFIWLIFLGAASGNLILRKLTCSAEDSLEWFQFSLAMGWGALGTVFAILGLLKLWYPSLIFGVLAIWTLFLLITLPKVIPTAVKVSSAWTLLDRLLVGCLIILAAFNAFAAMKPEIFYDALVYHLALPQLYWRLHGISPTPHNIYSGFPMLTEMVYGLALPLGGERLTHLMAWTFGIVSTSAAFSFCRRFYGLRAGLLAALIFYSTPMVGLLSWEGAAELSWAMFQFLAIYSFVLSFTEWPIRSHWLPVAGIFTGLAMSVKYTAWPFFLIMAILVAWRLRSEGGFIQKVAKFIGPAIAVVAIWPLRNVQFYHNPIFPFYQDKLAPGMAKVNWRMLMADAHSRNISIPTMAEGIKELLTHPWTELALPLSSFDSLGPLLVMGIPLLFVARSLRLAKLPLLGLLGALWISWFVSTSMPRFFVPVLLLTAVLYAAAIERLPKFARNCAYGFLLFATFENFLAAAEWFGRIDGYPVVLGQESWDAYLSRPHITYPRPDYAAALFIQKNLPQSSKILIFGDSRGFGIKRDFVASTRFSEDVMDSYIKSSKTPEEIRDRLLADGFTHILINGSEGRAGATSPLDTAEVERYSKFIRYLRPVFERKDPPMYGHAEVFCAVMEILRPSDKPIVSGLHAQADPKLAADSAESHFNKANFLISKGKFEEAIKQYQETLRLDPGNFKAHTNWAVYLAQNGKMEEAEHHLRDAIRLNPSYYNAHSTLGFVMLQLGRPDEADLHFREAIRLKPDFADAHLKYANFLAYQSRFAEAIKQYEETLRLDPNRADAKMNLTKVQESMHSDH